MRKIQSNNILKHPQNKQKCDSKIDSDNMVEQDKCHKLAKTLAQSNQAQSVINVNVFGFGNGLGLAGLIMTG